jgi:voltage-gated potassium channel
LTSRAADVGFTIEFLRIFGRLLFYLAPILLFLIGLITALGLAIGRRERWAKSDSLYYAFITATTVGYGDFRPSDPKAKGLVILIALVGLVMTGIIVALGVEAAGKAFIAIHGPV